MLIQSRRLRFFAEDKIVRLRRQVLAPLSLNEGQRISGIIQRRELDGPISGTEAAYRFKKGLREAYLSPFPIEVWPDLWSFSIHCEDQTGVASRLYEFFEDRGIRVLASEGTFTVSGDSNRVYFVLDMTAYGNLRDGDSETRRYLRGVRLYSLEEEMQLAFIHFLNIGNNELPDFQLFRINEYRSMWLRFERAKLEDPKPREIRKKGAVAQEVKPPQEAEWEYPRIGYFKSVIRKSNTIPPAVLRQMRSRSGETLAKVRQTQANFYHFPVGLDSTSSKFCWASGDPWAADGYDSFFKDAIWTMSTADPTSRLLRIIFVPDETSEEDAPIARTYSIHFLMAYPIREDDASLARVDTALARAFSMPVHEAPSSTWLRAER